MPSCAGNVLLLPARMSFVDELVSASAKVAAERQIKLCDDMNALIADTKRRVVDALDETLMTTLREEASKGKTHVVIVLEFREVFTPAKLYKDDVKFALVKQNELMVNASDAYYKFDKNFFLPNSAWLQLAGMDNEYCAYKTIQRAVQDQFKLKLNDQMSFSLLPYKLEVTFDWSKGAKKETAKRVREVLDERAIVKDPKKSKVKSEARGS